MNVFTIPLEKPEEKQAFISLINQLAEITKAAYTISDQLCIRTNSTRLSLILDQLACDDPDKPVEIERPVRRRRGGIRKGKPEPVKSESSSDNPY